MYHSTVQLHKVELACSKAQHYCQAQRGSCRVTSQAQRAKLDRAVNRHQEITMRSDTFESDILRLMREQNVPGLSLVTIRNGSMGKALALGVRDLSTNDPVDEKTIFGAASLTKPLAAYATLQLVDAGELDLDAPLSGFAGPVNPEDAASHSITTRHILTHSAGLPNVKGDGRPGIHFPPGSHFSYSSVGFLYLQKAIEAITQQPFETTLTQLVFEPLGMMSSSLAWRPQFEVNFASPHENGKPIAKQRLAAANASGSLQTTATDYGRFLLAALKGERLSKCTFHQWLEPVFHVPWATTEHLSLDPIKLDDDVAWGLGWGIEINRKSFFQWGWLDGTRAFVLGDPTAQSGAVLLTNSNTGLRLVPEIFEAVMPGTHSAIEWCKWNR